MGLPNVDKLPRVHPPRGLHFLARKTTRRLATVFFGIALLVCELSSILFVFLKRGSTLEETKLVVQDHAQFSLQKCAPAMPLLQRSTATEYSFLADSQKEPIVVNQSTKKTGAVSRVDVWEGMGVAIDSLYHPDHAVAIRNGALDSRSHLRVALFVGSYNHVVDGVVLTTNRLVQHLLSLGHEVLVFSPHDSTQLKPPVEHAGALFPIPSFRVPGRPEYQLSWGISHAAMDALNKFEPNIMHLATPDVVGLQAVAWANARGIPAICPYHTRFNVYFESWRLGFLVSLYWRNARSFYGKCMVTLAPTIAVREEVISNAGLEPTELSLWPRGVDTNVFSPARRCSAWRESLNIEENKVVILLVSRLCPEKGVDVFVATLKRLSASGEKFQAVVVGSGPSELKMRRSLPDALFMGSLRGELLSMAYANADIFLFPSQSETWGQTTLEAMSSGLAVITSAASGSTLVEHGVDGYLVENANMPDDFVDIVRSLIRDPILLQDIGEAARKSAFKWSWKSAMDIIFGHYTRAMRAQITSEHM